MGNSITRQFNGHAALEEQVARAAQVIKGGDDRASIFHRTGVPELAEVEHYRRVVERVAHGRSITSVRCADDRIVIDGTSPAQLRRALVGSRVIGTGRWGKHMWMALDRRPWLTMHFGMTGMILAPGETPLALAAGIDGGPNWPPRFTKLRLSFDDGGELVMTNPRRLGRIRLRDDPQSEPPISTLGFDPYLDMPSPAAFVQQLARRRGIIKALLLDQRFAAGVGNWVADEALYQSHIDPHRRAADLSPQEARRLRTCLARIVRRAVEVDARSADYPRTWLFHHHWGKKPNQKIQGQPLTFTTIAGRTTAWVPTRQS